MGFKWERSCFKCRIAINISPFLLSVIFVRIGVVIAKVRFSEGFITGNSPLCGTGLIENGKYRYFTLLDLEVIPILFVKRRSNRMSELLISSEPRSRRTAIGGNHLPILWETSHKLHNKYEGSILQLCHPIYNQYKVQIFLKERRKISPLRFEGHFTTHVRESVRII